MHLATNPLPIIERARSNPALMSMPVDGGRFGDVLDAQPRFRIEGAGPLSQRSIVPETGAAQRIMDGPRGRGVEQALRGLLATFDTRSDDVVLDGIALSTTDAGYGANILLGVASESPDLALGFTTSPRTPAERADLERYATTLMATNLAALGGPDSLSGLSTRYLALSPIVSRDFLELATTGRVSADDEHGRPDDDYGGAFRSHAAVSTAVHELAHRITPPEFLDPVERVRLETTREGRQQLATGAVFSEASAELLTNLPGVLSNAHRRIGTARPPRDGLQLDSYGEEVELATALLARAGLDPAQPADTDRIIDVLEGGALRDTPDRIADAIATHRRLDPGVRDELAAKLHRVAPTSDDTSDSSLESRTRAIVEWIDAIGA